MEAVVLSLCLLTTVVLIVVYSKVPKTKLLPSEAMRQPLIRGYVVDTSGCRIPDFSPFDWSVSEYYTPALRYNCTAKPSFIRRNGSVLLLDTDILAKTYNASPQSVHCWYRYLKRNESTDDADFLIIFSQKRVLHFGTPLAFDQIRVDCTFGENETHQELFLIPMLKPQVERRCNRKRDRDNNTDRMNVVFLGLDSVSRLNSLRHLPLTREYLEKNFHIVELFGYNKVGENSFPNEIAVLSGQSLEEGVKVCHSRVYDGEDIVWKAYAKLGYRTMFLEEWPILGLFTFYCKGFRRTPTDYYPRPLQVVADSSKSTDSNCLLNRLKTEVYLEYTTSLLVLLKDRPYFTYTWVTAMTHNYLNGAGYVDVPFLQTFQELSRTGVMKRSLVVFLSDHGIRQGDIRPSLMGKYEDRLPFCILMFPRDFRRKYPQLMESLRINQHRLTTPYDLHATLLELLQLPKTLAQPEFRTRRGLSLLHEIPEGRTCDDAFIHPHYCCCHETVELDRNYVENRRMAHLTVRTINGWLVKEARSLCWRHRLKDVLDVRSVMTNATAGVSYFWVTLMTTPGGAIFESTVGRYKSGDLNVEKISRINAYKPQSGCVTWAAPFCICK